MVILGFSISLVFVACVSILTRPISCITDADLFPHRTSDGSSYFSFSDDGKREIRFGSPFTIFNRTRSSIIISGNGVVGFGRSDMTMQNSAECTTVVTSDIQKIMAYWSDSYEKNGASLTYMETTRAPLLQKATQDITKAFPEFKRRDLGLSWLFIVTWRNLPICCSDSTGNRQNTFQLVLAKSATRSFVLLYYTKIEWYNYRWAAGFDFGNSRGQYRINGSCTPNFQSVTSTSNIGENGKWVFGVESDVKLPNTEDDQEEEAPLSIKPRVVSVIGNVPIIIRGPKIKETKTVTITCAFLDPSRARPSETPGVLITYNATEQHIICPVPFLYSLGRIELNLRVKYQSSSITSMYQGHIYAVKEDEIRPLPVINLDLKNNSISADSKYWKAAPTWMSDVKYTGRNGGQLLAMWTIDIVLLEYRRNAWKELGVLVRPNFPPAKHNGTYSFHFNMTKFNELLKPNAGKPYPRTLALKFMHIHGSNEPIWELLPSSILLATDMIISQQQIVNPTLVDNTTGHVYDRYCKTWYEKEPHPPTNIDTLPCPRTIEQAKLDWRFARDTKSAAELEIFNPGASSSYIQKAPSSSGAATQCTYDPQGKLLVRIPGAGRLLRSSPKRKEAWNHYTQDILPYLYCCKWGTLKESNCNLFYAKRPSNDGSNYVFPKPARVTGLSNIVNFGGFNCTYRRPGEIWMMKYSGGNNYDDDNSGHYHHHTEFKMQMRLEPYHSARTNKTFENVTTITAAVIEDITEDREVNVQVSLNPDHISLMVEGEDENLSTFNNSVPFNMYYDGVTISFQSRSRLIATFSSGFSVLFMTSGTNDSSLNIIVTGSPHITTSGTGFLLGDLNENIHNISEWIVQKNESLFYYPTGKSYADYNPKHNSTAINDVPHDYSQEVDSCEGFEECNHDYFVSQSDSISETGKDAHIIFQQILNASNSPIHQCKLPDGLEYGHFNVSSLVEGSLITAFCEPGYKLQSEEVTFICQYMNSSFMGESVSWMNGNLTMPSLACMPEIVNTTNIHHHEEDANMANETHAHSPNMQNESIHEKSDSSWFVVFICIGFVTIFVAVLGVVIAKCERLRPVRIFIVNSFSLRRRSEFELIRYEA